MSTYDNRPITDPSVPTHLVDNIWIGDASASKNKSFLLRNNIKRIVNCTTNLPFYWKDTGNFRIPIGDSTSTQDNTTFRNYLPSALAFARFPRSTMDSGILIHCHVGVSRSCSFAVAYLRAYHFDNIASSVDFVCYKRPASFFGGRVMNFKRALYDYFGR